MTSPTPAGSSATPVSSRTRLLHWSVAAPLSAAAGVGAAVVGFLVDMPVLGLAGAVVAAVPAVLAGRHVPALHADLDRCRAERARAAAAPATALAPAPVPTTADDASETAPVRPFVAEPVARPVARTAAAAVPTPQAPDTVDLAGAEQASAPRPVADPATSPAPTTPVDLVKPSTPEPAEPSVPAQHLVRHAAVAGVRVTTSSAAGATPSPVDPRVDTAELQKIWDLGEAPRTRSGRGRRVRVGAEVDALPDRPRNLAGHRRRARHRA